MQPASHTKSPTGPAKCFQSESLAVFQFNFRRHPNWQSNFPVAKSFVCDLAEILCHILFQSCSGRWFQLLHQIVQRTTNSFGNRNSLLFRAKSRQLLLNPPDLLVDCVQIRFQFPNLGFQKPQLAADLLVFNVQLVQLLANILRRLWQMLKALNLSFDFVEVFTSLADAFCALDDAPRPAYLCLCQLQ